MKNRVFNFSAGPATLPEDILNEIKDELLDFNGIGSSIIEISHRDKILLRLLKKQNSKLEISYQCPMIMMFFSCREEQPYNSQ
jgi:phosphoserine aminotransferase